MRETRISPCGSHHLDGQGRPMYAERFDEVLKFHPPGLAPVLRAGVAWHIREDGRPAYERRFLRTFGFYEGRAAVESEDGWHHIDVCGRDAYAERHAWCGNFQQARCPVRGDDGLYFHIGPDGVAIYGARWRYAGDYRDDVAVVQAEDGLSTHIDLHGGLLHGRWFVDLDVFHKGYARARDNDGWMHVDQTGRPIYARRFAVVEPFYNGQARVECFDGSLEVIDESGQKLVELRPARRSDFSSLSADLVGFWKTQSIATAVRLGVIDALPASSEHIARQCGLRTDASARLLRALGELGLTRREGACWYLSARGELLRSSHPMTLADAAVEYADRFSDMWRQLPEALREGAAWQAPDVFGAVAQDRAQHAAHHRMLRSYARHDYVNLVPYLGLRGDERIVDAGGGLGVLAEMVGACHPDAEVTVLERADVVRLASATSNRVRWLEGDLFKPWPIQADVVLMARVLHDWDDEAALQILLRARDAVRPGGRIFVIEMLLHESQMSGALCDLHLLAVTGGRERSQSAFEVLLSRAGFRVVQLRTLPALPSIIVAEAV